jgi:hypothetical protein
MAIVQALIAAVMRSAGRILNTAFGWATVMAFGKVPADRQIYLSLIAFGSVLWIVVVLGIAFPALGTFLLSFVPLPGWVSRGMVRLAMLGAAILVPPLIGIVALFLKDPADRAQGAAAKARVVLKGYPFTLGLAVTLVMMTVFAPILKIRTLARRWIGQHVPIMVEADDYEAVIGELQEALRSEGWETRREPASWLLRAPTKVLTWLAGGSIANLVADRLTTLRSDRLEATLHPADLVIEGKEADVVDARAVLAERMAFSRAHLTWTKEGNALEDRIRAVWLDAVGGGEDGGMVTGRLRALEEELKRAEVPFEEWEILFRAKLLVQVAAGCGAGSRRRETWPVKRTLIPLVLGVVHDTLQRPAVREKLDQAVVTFLGRLTGRDRRPTPSEREDRATRTGAPHPHAA